MTSKTEISYTIDYKPTNSKTWNTAAEGVKTRKRARDLVREWKLMDPEPRQYRLRKFTIYTDVYQEVVS